jgi:predicted small lipoprotein YifL
MKRRTLALLALATLAALAGCAGFGGGLDEERLAQNASYDWDTTADVTVTVEGDEYQAVYEVEDGTEVEAFRRETLGGRTPVEVAAVQFRYPNGTVVNASAIEVEEADSRVVIRPPAEKGKLAYSAPADAGWFGLPVTVAGSYEVVLPPGRRVGNPVFGDVSPGDYEVSTDDQDRVHLRWSSLEDGSIAVRSYLQRDLYLFGGLLALLALVSVGGVVYYRIQIRRLERRREEAGLDVDLERDDDSDGPPLR